ncbi:hypothetical protein GALMADRAFT_917091 [Galerina marginata CBS 339.88]|uniref:Uncharacterized protein n=1 Tax=Galerina marginata (strain CBS 339.88) TaxID=685588 RepID=A0A067SFC6_GALM3|nr:hypothetical protein GALMADRAFT_917091 [Galerina marginata CBS 339.88]
MTKSALIFPASEGLPPGKEAPFPQSNGPRPPRSFVPSAPSPLAPFRPNDGLIKHDPCSLSNLKLKPTFKLGLYDRPTRRPRVAVVIPCPTPAPAMVLVLVVNVLTLLCSLHRRSDSRFRRMECRAQPPPPPSWMPGTWYKFQLARRQVLGLRPQRSTLTSRFVPRTPNSTSSSRSVTGGGGAGLPRGYRVGPRLALEHGGDEKFPVVPSAPSPSSSPLAYITPHVLRIPSFLPLASRTSSSSSLPLVNLLFLFFLVSNCPGNQNRKRNWNQLRAQRLLIKLDFEREATSTCPSLICMTHSQDLLAGQARPSALVTRARTRTSGRRRRRKRRRSGNRTRRGGEGGEEETAYSP